MTSEEYYQVMDALAPSMGEMPIEIKRKITDFLREHPGLDISPATDKELGAIFNYLNHKPKEIDFFNGDPGFARYKDAVICLNYEKTEWVLLTRRPDDLLWDVWNYIQHFKTDTEFERNMRNIYSLR